MGPGGGDLIHHNPDAAQDDPIKKRERLRRTKEVYRDLFQKEPEYKIWLGITPGSMCLFVKAVEGKTLTLFVDPNESVEYIKLRIQVNLNFGSFLALLPIRLVFIGC